MDWLLDICCDQAQVVAAVEVAMEATEVVIAATKAGKAVVMEGPMILMAVRKEVAATTS